MADNLCVLIVDDDQRMAQTLRDIFKVKGYRAEVAHSSAEALDKMTAVHPDCVLSDIRMPEASGVELCRALKAVQPGLPVVLMTAYSTDDLVQEGLEEGILAILTKPLNINLLLRFLAVLHQERSVVIADDDPEFCKTLGGILRGQCFTVTEITEVSSLADRLSPEVQVLLLDMKLNHADALGTLREIKERHPNLPVILVTAYREEMTQAIEAALQLGAYACLYKPFPVEELLRVLTEALHWQMSKSLGQFLWKWNPSSLRRPTIVRPQPRPSWPARRPW